MLGRFTPWNPETCLKTDCSLPFFAIDAMSIGRRSRVQRWLLLALLTGALAIAVGDRTWAQIPLPAPTFPEVQSQENLFFADVVVRGQPIFQIGGLGDLNATERAQIVNRRIASLLTQFDTVPPVTVQPDPDRSIATLQVNNRVLMTVTQQDAQDFNSPVETLAQQWAAELNRAFDRPPLAIDVGQRLYFAVRQFQRDAIDRLPALLGGLLAIGLTWLLAASAKRILMADTGHWEVDRNSKLLVAQLGFVGVWVLGTVVALGVLGLDFITLFGALGLTSVAIGLSLRDVVANYFSGIILLASRPFRLGDQIAIGEHEGTVTQIQLRATTIQTYDGRTVYIPNQQVFNTSIINNTIATVRRSSILLEIGYEADIRNVQKLLRAAVLQTEGVESEPPPDILVRELGINGVKIEVRDWVNSRRLSFLESTSRVAIAIKEALQAAGIEMPDETYIVKLENQLATADRSPAIAPIGSPNLSNSNSDRA
ncbi:MAG: mechanosensitive ion channel family protein [Cyanosarcina radialis HA8281-LM2]|jgi:small-conductance mechanosensitive channel|nr:mechanosensitive ion channel family protein [Cyanosarcina radialis HA8281-LM2]